MSKYKWLESEEDCAYYGKRVSMSGAGESKGDYVGEGYYEDLVIENKFTEKESYSLKVTTLEKAARDGRQYGKKFALRLDFNGRVYMLQEEDQFRRVYESNP